MTMKRVVLEIGMGTDIRGADYTKAAVRALRDALWHNSFRAAAALGLDADDMQVEVNIGVPKPDQVDTEAVLAVLPHGTGTVNVVEGGLEISDQTGTGSTVIDHRARRSGAYDDVVEPVWLAHWRKPPRLIGRFPWARLYRILTVAAPV